MLLARLSLWCFLLIVMPGALSVDVNPLNGQHLRIVTMEVSIYNFSIYPLLLLNN